MNVEQEILETGIKVVDLLAPYVKGGKIGEGWGGEGNLCTQATWKEKKESDSMLPGYQA